MSDTHLHRVDSSLTASKQISRRGPQPTVAKPFDAAKAAIKAASEPKPIEALGLHSRALAEAMDGDGSEALARATMGSEKVAGEGDHIERLSSTRKGQKTDGSRVVQQVQEDPDADGVETADRQAASQAKARFETASRVESVGVAEPSSQSISSQHDELMMLSSTMSRRELATHLARKHASRLTEIFSGEAWRIAREATNKLNAAQMPL
jgi:hypothetical protein